MNKPIPSEVEKLLTIIKEAHKEYAKTGISPFSVCGSNGGDAHHYHLPLYGTWGSGQVYISFSNHGYIDKDNLSVYTDEDDWYYAPTLRVY